MSMSIGTLRGLQQISNPSGVFTMVAMDQRGALERLLGLSSPNYDLMRQVKIEVVGALAPHATGILIDPEYGAAECIAAGAIPGRTGIIVSIEETGYTLDGSGRLAVLLENWGAGKIKRLGASAVKLLVYYHPEEKRAAQHQRDIVSRVLDDCRTYDIPLLVEAVSYPLEGQDKAAFAATKPEVVVQTAVELTPLGFDVFKAEFPVDLAYPHDESTLGDWCRKLDEACPMPWVILSAGVDIDQFVKQVEVACTNGASGFLAGRAIWKEAVAIKDSGERKQYLATRAVDNLRRCVELAEQHARPFLQKLNHPNGYGEIVQQGWMKDYPGI